MISKNQLHKEIKEYIVECFLFGYSEELDDDLSFLEIGILDSTGIMELVAFIQRQYKINVQDNEITPDNLDSVNNIANFIMRKKNGDKNAIL